MEKIVVVSDSTANLPPELLQELDIPVIPLHIHWGEETYLDGVTLSQETFYRWRRKLGGMEVSDARRLKQLEDENRRLKKLVADLSLDKQMLQEVVDRKW